MFSFFKKKDKLEKTEQKIELSLQEMDSITEENQQLMAKIAEAKQTDD